MDCKVDIQGCPNTQRSELKLMFHVLKGMTPHFLSPSPVMASMGPGKLVARERIANSLT